MINSEKHKYRQEDKTMAQGEYVGKRVTATIPQEIHDKLIEDARMNGLKPSTRAAQLISLYYNQKQGQPSVGSTTTTTVDSGDKYEYEEEI